MSSSGGIPVGGAKVRVGVMIDPLTWAKFKKLCFDHEQKYSHIVEKLMQDYIFLNSSKSNSL